MKIVIFSGGTGSVALQTGLYELYGNDIEVNVITNLYDNGFSTGAVRQVLDGQILGPSDLRKNQTLRYYLKYGQTKLSNFLDIRFSSEAASAETYCLNELNKLDFEYAHIKSVFERAIKCYFNQSKALQITYDDFSISNIIYAGLAGQFNDSMEVAGIEMAKLLEIEEDSVIPSSDESLFLQAITKSGYNILDEGDIVSWNNPEDPIVDIKLVDVGGCDRLPQLTPRAQNAMLNADIIVLSSGTQWSSLIPTYVCTNFLDTLEQSKAFKDKAIYSVINNIQDKDMTGINAYQMINIIDRYIPKEHIKFIFNKNASDEMSIQTIPKTEEHINCSVFTLSEEENAKKHHGPSLAWAIMHQYYNKFILNDTFIFDYDDTLVGRNSEYFNESHANKLLLWRLSVNHNVNIITGNAEKHVNLEYTNKNVDNKVAAIYMYLSWHNVSNNITLYADGGINKFTIGPLLSREYSIMRDGATSRFIECIDKGLRMSNNEVKYVINKIESIGINVNKIQNRNNVTISIKPIDNEYRKPISILLQKYLGNEYFIRPTGRTTIDISKSDNFKTKALNDILKGMDVNCKVVYVGDEGYDGGNDYELTHHKNVNFLHVKNPRDTLIFLKTLLLSRDNKNNRMLGRPDTL